MPKYEQEFRFYLKRTPSHQGNYLDETQINMMVRILNANLIAVLGDDNSNINSLLDINNIKFLEELKNRLRNNGNLYEFNQSIGNGVPSRALFQYINFLKQYTNINTSLTQKNKEQILNQILYGPPGTGKTYNTINEALKIIDGVVPTKRDEAKKRFEELSDAGQIEFVTFHQSYGYEEFVEGIKALTDENDNILYKTEDGIFKKLAKKASKIVTSDNEISFMDAYNKYLQSIRERKLLKTKSGSTFGIEVNARENLTLLTGLSLQKNGSITKEKLQEYILYDKVTDWSSYLPIIGEEIKGMMSIIDVDETKNYILIIDEINRGNISKIFGELITLIEPSKRIGEDEELKLRLPYSNDEFGVPSNLYIIGTMNTADRSIALMDTALRRRFEFVEMMPNPCLLFNDQKTEDLEDPSSEENILDLKNWNFLDKNNNLFFNEDHEHDLMIETINLRRLLYKINQRVEYLYDRDHTIGHAYFMELSSESTLSDLNSVMRNRIIPLLQEYFYDDWAKVLLVLDDGFISKKSLNAQSIFGKDIDEYLEEDKFEYSIKEDFSNSAYTKIYKTQNITEHE